MLTLYISKTESHLHRCQFPGYYAEASLVSGSFAAAVAADYHKTAAVAAVHMTAEMVAVEQSSSDSAEQQGLHIHRLLTCCHFELHLLLSPTSA